MAHCEYEFEVLALVRRGTGYSLFGGVGIGLRATRKSSQPGRRRLALCGLSAHHSAGLWTY